jgi:hypothetical protein
MKAPKSCHVCARHGTTPTILDFTCPTCGSRMHELRAPELGLVLHCPRHCSTLIPSPRMMADAQARRN